MGRMERWWVPAATLVLLAAGCGASPDDCGRCDPGFVCYFGSCVPDLDARGADADADAEASPEIADTAEPETPVEVETGAEADEVVPPPDVADDVPVDVPIDVPVDVPPACPDPVAHDEDGDGVDDACDRCPTIPDPEQRDGDGDGLGDACEARDPDLLSHLEAFAAFLDNRLETRARWLNDGGTWTPAPDVVTGSSSPYGANRWLEARAGNPYAVEARFRPQDAPRSGSNYTGVLFGVQAGAGGVAPTWWGCFFEWDNRSLSLWRNDGRAITNVAFAESAVEDNATPRDTARRLRAVWDGRQVVCTFDNEAGGHGELAHPVDPFTGMSLAGMGGLRVYNETTTFLSFVLYR